MKSARVWCLVALMSVVGAAEARADGYATVFTGVNFGGTAGQTLSEAVEAGNRLTFGGSIGWMGAGVFGIELDIAHTNNFYGDGGMIGSNSVTSIIPALVLGVPFGGQAGFGVRPYATAGFGWISRDLEVSDIDIFSDNNGFAYSLGGGVNIYFSDHFGIRGDYRYIHGVSLETAILGIALEDPGLDYSRATIGALFRF